MSPGKTFDKNIVGAAATDECTTSLTEDSPNESRGDKRNPSQAFTRKLTPSFSNNSKAPEKGIEMHKDLSTKTEPLVVDTDMMYEQTLYNHLEGNYHLSNKKALFYNMKAFCESKGEDVFEYLPQTFHIKDGLLDKEFIKFEKCYKQLEQSKNDEGTKPKLHNTWIVKPGENTNRGCGIQFCTELEDIKAIVGRKVHLSAGKSRSYIVQKYLDNPFLYNKRKFDIR